MLRSHCLILSLIVVMGLSLDVVAQTSGPGDDQPSFRIRPLAQNYVTVFESPDPENVYLYDPGMLALPDGRLIGTYSFGGKGVADYCKSQGWVDAQGEPQYAAVATSDDGGKTWTVRARYAISYARAFAAGPSLYIIGARKDIYILRSDDRGETWTAQTPLTSEQAEHVMWHQSATSVWHTDTHVYLVMERRTDRGIQGWRVGDIAPVLMRGKLTDDLTKRENWTFASELVFQDVVDPEKLNYVGIPFFKADLQKGEPIPHSTRKMFPMGWLETNVVQITDPDDDWYDPTGHTFHLLSRCNTGGTNIACLSKVVENADGSMTTMLEKAPSGKDMLFIPFPGGHMKFFVLFDKQTKLFWLLGSQSTDSLRRGDRLPPERFSLPNNERHRMVLYFSRNLLDWCFAGLVAEGPSPKQSRHYAGMDIDGDDLVILSRSGDERAKDAHNGNIITFHRVQNFRSLVY